MFYLSTRHTQHRRPKAAKCAQAGLRKDDRARAGVHAYGMHGGRQNLRLRLPLPVLDVHRSQTSNQNSKARRVPVGSPRQRPCEHVSSTM